MNEEKMADSLHQSVEMIEEKVKLAGSSLGRIVDEVENVFRSIERLIGLFQDNKKSFAELTSVAATAVSPATEKGKAVLKDGASVGQTFASRAGENPVPVILGAALVIGGLGLLGYYLSESGFNFDGQMPSTPETPADDSSTKH